MAYRSYFRSLLNDNFKILTWVLILFIAITPNFIFMQSANAAVGGWTMSNPIAQGASTVYTGTKQLVINGADYVKKGTAIVTPTATGVAKVLAKGVAGVALSVAVEQLLGAVDWVLDPSNNRIKYTLTDPSDPSTSPLLYRINAAQGFKATTPEQVCSQFIAYYKTLDNSTSGQYRLYINPSDEYQRYQCQAFSGSWFTTAYISIIANPDYDPNADTEEKYLPLPVLAEKVISNAQSNTDKRAAAQAATTAAAADIVAEAETDNVKARPIAQQLEASSSTKPADEAAAEKANEAKGEAKPNEANPEATDIALEFPVFCNWAPIVCEAAQTAVNFMTDFEPDAESGEVTIHQDSNIIFDDSQRVNFSTSCPSPEQFSVSFFGATQNLEFSYQPLCNFMSMIKPFVVAGSYVIGAYIVMGLSRGSAD